MSVMVFATDFSLPDCHVCALDWACQDEILGTQFERFVVAAGPDPGTGRALSGFERRLDNVRKSSIHGTFRDSKNIFVIFFGSNRSKKNFRRSRAHGDQYGLIPSPVCLIVNQD